MAVEITVQKLDEGKFRVEVSGSPHIVTLKPGYHQKLTGGKITDEELVRRSFEFLLAREPEESILTEFDLPVIARYFPEYEGEMNRSCSGGL